ncbi:type I polyketide synthase, partial [Actinoplanes teichomyceticus]
FQHQRYWLAAGRSGTPGAHPLIGTPVELPDGGGLLFSARWSEQTHPWLAEHSAAAFVECALRAGDEVGCDTVAELTVEAPLALPADVRVHVGEPDATGRRRVHIDARTGGGWTRHARAVLTGDAEPVPFPPAGPETVEVAVAEADGLGLHPTLLQSALDGFPARWTGIRLYAVGATTVRAQLAPHGPDTVALYLTDPAGAPVASVDAIHLTPPPAPTGTGGPLYTVRWQPVPLPPPAAHGDVRVLEAPAGDHRTVTAEVLERVQAWLAEPGDSRLVVVTRGAVEPADPSAAAVWGLLRSAQAEHPGRIVLLDADGVPEPELLAAALATGEPQLALHAGQARVPRLVRVDVPDGPAPAWDPAGTALLTGGTGSLGRIVARHLVREHGFRSLIVISRRGPAAPDADALAAELAGYGARVRFVAADAADRAAVAGVLASVPPDAPLTAVVHLAGVLDDGVLTSLTAERLDRVSRPKADAALVLDELTRDLDRAAFVLFSSAAGILGNPGQGNYAAANAVLDAVARRRRAAGLPGTSLAWGGWATADGMTAHLGVADVQRHRHTGMAELTESAGLALLDSALRSGEAAVVPAAWDLTALRALAATAELPAPLRGLVPARRRAAAGAAPAADDLTRRLAGLDPAGREELLLELVSRHAGQVLGHSAADRLDTARPFREQGFDSLTSVELRNRLADATGLRLAPTLLYDHPSVRDVARHLAGELLDTRAGTAVPEPGRAAADEPIAVVAMACRFPGGVGSPEQLWDLVAGGVDAITDFPADRGWDLNALHHPDPDHPGTTYARRGAFLDDPAGFDAEFFGISPREALAMDPQQRLMLETSWETFERAGIDPAGLRGQQIGVFVGVNTQDYALRLHRMPELVEGHRITGASNAVVSGRVSYFLGLHGPSITLDTACSSSLVALHLAAQSLRSGECTMALAGGVTVMTGTDAFVDFARQRGLSPDGRCKAFAEAADGTGWAEGAGVLLLERLSDAVRNGHRVLGVVRGSAVNQDGASNGLTAPNGPAQQRVIRAALANARLAPRDVDAVEAHGTGTRLGDPIEAQALLATYGQERPEPLWLGSVKSNIGHTQAAAGVAGVIKMVMAMRHGILPPSLHIDEPTSRVDWPSGAVRLLTEARPWPESGHPRRAGVSGFGVSGTNAHVILEQAPPAPVAAAPAGPPRVTAWPVSATTRDALRAQAARLAAFVRHRPDLHDLDIGRALQARTRFDQRAVVVGADRDRLLAGLDAVAAGDLLPGDVVLGSRRPGRLAVLFPGQGSQRPGMGRRLYERYPVFRSTVDDFCAAFDLPLRDLLFGDAAGSLDATVHAQPALLTIETALYRLFESWGVRPDVLAGHSLGEITAAHVAGVLSLADAATMVAARGRLMQAMRGDGAMVAVDVAEEDVRPLLSAGVEIAAVNGPRAVVLSGDADAVLALAGRLADGGHRTRRLRVSHAFHSAHMDAMLDEFRGVVAGLKLRPPRLPVISNRTGGPAGADQLCSPDYWVDQVRGTVRFLDGVRALHAEQVTTFLELGPGAALTSLAEAASTGRPPGSAFLTSMDRDEAEDVAVLTALAHLDVRGVPVDWTPLYEGGRPGLATELPTYAFQHRRFWLDEATPFTADVPAPDVAPAAATVASRRALLDLVRARSAAVLGHDRPVEPGRDFRSLGFDSLAGLRLRAELQSAVGIELPATLVFDHPTAAAVADFLATQLTPGSTVAPAPAPVPATRAAAGDPIAIVGMACRFPGGVRSPEDLWELVAAEADGISDFPVNRGWDLEGLF